MDAVDAGDVSCPQAPTPVVYGDSAYGSSGQFLDALAVAGVESKCKTQPPTSVVAAYRSQSEVESGFPQVKDPYVVSFGPMHHWTDSKIRVHVFYCVLALTIAHLMRRQANEVGLDLSVRELLGTLAGIGETVLLYHDGSKGRPRARRILTDMNPTHKQLADLFAIDRYAPTR